MQQAGQQAYIGKRRRIVDVSAQIMYSPTHWSHKYQQKHYSRDISGVVTDVAVDTSTWSHPRSRDI
jgi:dTDP-4-dehydrorhamnose 3,5-epimerase-like enzyme